MDRLQVLEEFQPFDIFVHTYCPAGTAQSPKDATQLWAWKPLGSSSGFGWKPVDDGYVCPGPGVLKGRHLVFRHGKPAWLLGATVYRRHKEVNPYTTAPELGGYHDDENVTFKGTGTLYWDTNTAKRRKQG